MKILVAICCIISLSCLAQENIPWTPNLALTWDDYEGVPDYKSEYTAITYRNLSVKQIGLSKDHIVLVVETFMVPEYSWTKTKEDDTLLIHELYHMYIAEIIARKFREALQEHTSESLSETKEFIDSMYTKFLAENDSLDQLYDFETDFSKNRKAQKMWIKKINHQLEELESYADVKVIIKRL